MDSNRGGVGSAGTVTLAEAQLDHPALNPFEGEAEGGLLTAKSQAYLLLQPEAKIAF